MYLFGRRFDSHDPPQVAGGKSLSRHSNIQLSSPIDYPRLPYLTDYRKLQDLTLRYSYARIVIDPAVYNATKYIRKR